MGRAERIWIGLVAIALLVAGGAALLRTGTYGWTLFLLHPLVSGGLAAWMFRPRTAGRAAGVGALAVLATSGLALLFGWEGAVCIVMCLPIVMPAGAIGGLLVYGAERSTRASRGLAMMLLLPPVSIPYDLYAPPPVFQVRSAIEVAAPPEQVWQRVLSFAELPPPRELIFRAGVAYPTRTRLEGSGPGAVRYCEFSTGPFVEPIEIWDEPRLLAFRVAENPAPMQEWSPFANLVTRHLHGYLVSKRGQFQLTALPNGRTLLVGTTWYQHGLWPAEYWRWWSDAIIHRIHLRVLEQIRVLAEADAPGGRK